MSKELLRLEPVFQEKIWGGDRLRTVFHYDIPSDHTGECWAISGHPSVRADYSESLLALAKKQHLVVPNPIAFSENTTKDRITKVLRF